MELSGPLFVRISQEIEHQVLSGALSEDSQVPSTNELAAFHCVNPATAAKGVSLLVDQGLLYRKRGVGVFVSRGARKQLVTARQKAFRDEYVRPMVREAGSLDLQPGDVLQMVSEEFSRATTKAQVNA